jgi:hypothetical protein
VECYQFPGIVYPQFGDEAWDSARVVRTALTDWGSVEALDSCAQAFREPGISICECQGVGDREIRQQRGVPRERNHF